MILQASFIGTLFLFVILYWVFRGVIRLIMLFSGLSRQQSRSRSYTQDRFNDTPSQTDFLDAILGLFASVMKADGVVLKSELYVVKQYLRNNLSQEDTLKALAQLKTLLDTPFTTEEKALEWAHTIRTCTNANVRMNILFTLIEIAMVDGQLSPREHEIIMNIGQVFGINAYTVQALENMVAGIYGQRFGGQQQGNYSGYEQTARPSQSSALAKAYETLGLQSDADDETVKRTYRKLAAANHPDRFANESAETQRQATETFQAINEAYEYIKAARGMK